MAMELLDRPMLDELMAYRDDTCVAIYLPMERRGADVRGNSVRLKNQLSEVAATLEASGWRRPEIDDFLDRPRQLLEDSNYWQHQQDGFALFMAPGFYETLRLPLSFEPLAVVSERFHIKPLLPLLGENGVYYILALSQNKVRLLKGTRFSIEEIDAELMAAAGIPGDIDEALAFDDPEEQLQYRTITAGEAGGPELLHHGHTIEDEKRQRQRRFVQAVGKGVATLLKGSDAPIVVAAVGYLHALAADVARLPTIAEDFIEGNPEHTQIEALRQRAWEIVSPGFEEARETATTRYKELPGNRTTDRLQELVPAAVQGRIGTLFVARNKQVWGHYNMETHEVVVDGASRSNGEDLLDYAVVHTLTNGGDVYLLDEDELPAQSDAAAILRF